ncbi:sulfite oxidase [Streptomyces sp. BI20]|uniref:sulfite oxidase n=1 Tax=Streptomyces sp. BI20 TaxID=3403460 RepID=UPI003C715C97
MGADEGIGEWEHDRTRLRQWARGRARTAGLERRDLLRLFALGAAAGAAPVLGAGPAAASPAPLAAAPPAPPTVPGTVKPLPPEWFTVRGTNAETRFSALRGTGHETPIERFFVRNHTVTPVLDRDAWRLRVWGAGLRGGRESEFSLRDLRRLPVVERTLAVECAGNGRGFYTSQQGQAVSGTAWTLGAIGVARWRGARLADVLRAAGITRHAVDVLPRGLDAEVVTNGVNLGRVRRPLPVSKALDDVLVVWEMNGRPLPADHGAPARLVVPGWIGISSIKWLGDVEVATEPLYSPWNTDLYRMFGPEWPAGGSEPLTRQSLKSAFELDLGAELPAHRTHVLTGRSWSGGAPVREVEVSVDGGLRWRRARLHDAPRRGTWVRWSVPWTPHAAGPAVLLARAADASGRVQPEVARANAQGYLFDAVVRHPVTVVA